MAVVICVKPSEFKDRTVTIPGLGQLRAIKQDIDAAPTPSGIAMVLLAQATPALNPIITIVKIVEVLVAIYNMLKSLDSPLDLITAIKKLIRTLQQAISFLTTIAPGVAYIVLVKDILDLLSAIIRSTADVVARWILETEQIVQALRTAELLNDPELSVSAQCAQDELFEVQKATQASLQDVGQILKLVALLIRIIENVIRLRIPELAQLAKTIEGLVTNLPFVPTQTTSQTALNDAVQKMAAFSTTLTQTADLMDSTVAKVAKFI